MGRALGPTSNPFASRYVRPGALSFEFQNGTVDGLVANLKRVRLGAIVGDHGTGKSTLLRELAERLADRMPGGVWVQLTREAPTTAVDRLTGGLLSRIAGARTVVREQRDVAVGGVLIVDGAEQLPVPWRWVIARQAIRRGHSCLLTSHHDLRGFETLYRTSLSPELVLRLIDELVPPSDEPAKQSLRARVDEHISNVDLTRIRNLRLLWDELYDMIQTEQT